MDTIIDILFGFNSQLHIFYIKCMQCSNQIAKPSQCTQKNNIDCCSSRRENMEECLEPMQRRLKRIVLKLTVIYLPGYLELSSSHKPKQKEMTRFDCPLKLDIIAEGIRQFTSII